MRLAKERYADYEEAVKASADKGVQTYEEAEENKPLQSTSFGDVQFELPMQKNEGEKNVEKKTEVKNSDAKKKAHITANDVRQYSTEGFGYYGVRERDNIQPDVMERLVNEEKQSNSKSQRLVDGVLGRVYSLGFEGKSLSDTYYSGVLNDEQARRIYHAGELDAEKQSESVYHKNAKLIRDKTFESLKLTDADARVLDAIAAFTGRNVRFAELAKGVNAQLDTAKGEIVISTKARSKVRAGIIHEAIHSLRESAPSEYNKLAKSISDIISKCYTDADFIAYRRIVEQAYREELTAKDGKLKYGWEELITEEMVCDIFSNVISDSKLISKLGQKQLSGLARAVNAIRDFAQSIREKLIVPKEKYATPEEKEKARIQRAAYRALSNRAEGLASAFAESLEKASPGVNERVRKEEGEVKQSRDLTAQDTNIYDYTKSFAQQVDDWIAGKIPKRDSLLVGGTPKVFTDIGFNALPMTIDQSHVALAINGGKEDHKIGAKKLKKLPEALKNPIAIFESATAKGRVVALLEINYQGNSVIAPVEIDGFSRQNNITIDSNDIVSVHGRSNAVTGLLKAAVIKEYSGQASLFYWDKKRALTLLQAAGLQLPRDLPQDGSIHSIRENDSNVKPKFTDVTQTQQFKRWFGKSKVVNEDGTPKVVYHGTNADFWTFDTKTGVYFFSESYDYAEAMAEERKGNRIIEAYLKMRKPYTVKLAANEFSNPNFENKHIRYAKENGYDGVIFENDTDNEFAKDTFYVVFDSTQIKSATDNIGTFDGNNPDIRYSLQLTDVSENADITSQANAEAQKKAMRDREIQNAKRQLRIERWRSGEGFDGKVLNNKTLCERLALELEEQHPEHRELANRVYKYTDSIMEHWLVESGALTKEQWKQLLKNRLCENSYYI